MTKQAHITSNPNVGVGDKALALCGKDFKVKVLWTDVPTEKPICRECVDVALDAMTEADALITRARVQSMLMERRLVGLTETLNPPDLFLDVLADNEAEYTASRIALAETKAERKRAKTTCTCTWLSDSAREPDPDCVIHGGEVEPEPDDTPVAPEEDNAGGDK